MKKEQFNGIEVIVGQNAQENWNMINFDSDYLWLHLDSFPSCHVIIKDNDPNMDTIIFAAELCKENTKYRDLRNLKVCYTRCNNLKKGPDVGSVIYKSKRQVKTIKV